MEPLIYHVQVDSVSTARSAKRSLKSFLIPALGKRIRVDLLPALVRETTADELETGYEPDTPR